MFRKLIDKCMVFLEKKNEMESLWLREFFKKKYGISIGLYSYGCFDLKRVPKNTIIGRYCSFSPSSYMFSRNHGVNFMSLHAYLYNSKLGMFNGADRVEETRCIVEDDVWFGHNSIVTPSVSSIGRGAIIAAGAVVTKNVPKYAIVAGNPAKVIRVRFTEDVIAKIEESQWWLKDKKQLLKMMEEDKGFVYAPSNKGFIK